MKHNEVLEIAYDESDGDKSEVSYMDVDDDEDSDYSEDSWDSGSDSSEDEGELAAAYFDCLEDDASEVEMNSCPEAKLTLQRRLMMLVTCRGI